MYCVYSVEFFKDIILQGKDKGSARINGGDLLDKPSFELLISL